MVKKCDIEFIAIMQSLIEKLKFGFLKCHCYLFIYLLWFIVQNMQHGSPRAKVNRIYITNKNIEYRDR